MSDNNPNNNQSWLVPICVALIGAISTIVVAWLNRPTSPTHLAPVPPAPPTLPSPPTLP